MLLRPDSVPDARWTWLPLLAGLAVAGAIHEVSGVQTRLKWPNDVLVDGKKLAGVLLERHGSAAVVGVGINVTTSADELPTADATSLFLAGAPSTDRETVLRSVLRSLDRRYQSWCDGAGDPATLAAAYADKCDTLGAEIRVELPNGETVEGVGERIDDEGRLVVATKDGERPLSAGDVVHVRAS
ncbi:MAG: BirA family transcriptional regulator [Frankiales bacterium]|nr:BirA family transcriptional regulator [Frankiales bacterium]